MIKKIVFTFLIVVLFLINTVACSSQSPSDNAELSTSESPGVQQTSQITPQNPDVELFTLVMSEKPRITASTASPQDIKVLAEGNLAFASDLYTLLRTQEGNLFFSPYSISQALAMIYAGAKGETEEQIADTFHFDLPQDTLHPAFNTLDMQLTRSGSAVEGADGEAFRLNIVNASWGQRGYIFLQKYLDTLAQYYGAGVRLLDFINAPEPSRTTINQWVSDQTEGKIQDLLPSSAITELTRLVLTNTIYFNAAWQSPFKEEATEAGIFHRLDGSQVAVPMMKQNANFGYADGDNYQAVELPYSFDGFSMVVLLPTEGEFEAFEKSIDPQLLSSIQDSFEYRQVALSIPRFEFDSSFSLKKALSEMGMPAAFSDSADFSSMNGNRDLYIADVLHKAFISVDEAGTEAAAATGVIMALKGIPDAPLEMTVNRPFLFFICDIETNTILFVGRVLDPSH